MTQSNFGLLWRTKRRPGKSLDWIEQPQGRRNGENLQKSDATGRPLESRLVRLQVHPKFRGIAENL
jgi:hypothetical protein